MATLPTAPFCVSVSQIADLGVYSTPESLIKLVVNDIEVSSSIEGIEVARRRKTTFTSTEWHQFLLGLFTQGDKLQDEWKSVLDVPAGLTGLGLIPTKVLPEAKESVTTHCVYPTNEWAAGSAVMPYSTTTNPHIDYEGATSYLIHISGKKIWCVWPLTDHNMKVLHSTNSFDDNAFLLLLRKLEGLQLLFFDDGPTGFIMPPFTIHGVLTVSTAVHCGGPVYERKNASTSLSTIEKQLELAASLSTSSDLQEELYRVETSLGHWTTCINRLPGTDKTDLLKRIKALELKVKVSVIYDISVTILLSSIKVGMSTPPKRWRVALVPCLGKGGRAASKQPITYVKITNVKALKWITTQKSSLSHFMFTKGKPKETWVWETVSSPYFLCFHR